MRLVFSAVPAGYYFGGNVNYSGGNAYFWSSTPNEINAFNTYNYYFIANYRYVYPTINHKYYGFSVRCVRDDAPPSTVDITCPFSGDTTVIQNGGFNYKHSGTGWDATTTVAGATLSYTLSGATTGSGTTLNNVTFNLGTTTVKWKATLGAEADSCSFRVNVATNIPACPACIGETTVTDVDGNVYQARTMPDGKMWMIENLRTTKYANGDTIRKRTNEWVIGDDDYKPYFVKPSQATPDGGGSFTFDKDTLWGYYYNWAAAVGLLMNISGNGDNLVTPDANGHVQGICPAGWHLPSDAEWATLRDSTDNLDGNAGNNNEAVYMACTNSGWNTGDLTAASNGAAQNSTCFSAPPAGSYFNGTVFNSGNFAYFWSTTPAEGTAYGAYYYGFSYYYRNVFRYDGNKVLGFSVRCVRD
ncbi:hypothetical protein LJB75_01245 [Bacteroidales bacterium OttesenSCG-928-L19]|nr:hypothetical protein [Bacteroidales bacterium OttesenSCG-928-L19]